MSEIIRGINPEMSNEAYHANKTHYSSSQIKTLYWDTEKFHREYILGQKEPMKQSDGLTLGTLIHTKILEEHLFDNSVIVSSEFHKRGNAWKEFVAANEHTGKHLISGAQKLQLDNMYEAYLKRPEAVQAIKNSKTEVTIGSELMGTPVKIRCDALDLENGIISDLKSTAYSAELEVFKQNAYSQMLSYDISAAFYTMIAEQEFGRPFDFHYIVISKSEYRCEIYKSSQVSLINGRNKIFKALERLKHYREHGTWPNDVKKVAPTSSNYEIKEL